MEGADARLFRNPSFRALWIGQLVSIFGDRLTYLALLALIVERARDPGNPAPELALIPVASFLPAILFGPIVGALVDTWNIRRVLIASDFARGCLVLLLIPAAAWGGLPAAFVLVFLLYTANTFFLPARSAILPDLVPEESLVKANSLATLAGVVATIAGSFAGGLLVERVGWRWGFALDGATYFVSVFFLALTRPKRHERVARPARWSAAYRVLLHDVAEGARLTVSHRAVLGSLLSLVCLWIAGGALHVAGTVLVKNRAAGFVSGMGGILSAVGFGMVAGTLLLATAGARFSKRLLVALGLSGAGLMLAIFSFTPAYLTLALLALLAGFFVALLLVTTEAVMQVSIGPEARARVFALRDFSTRFAVLGTALLLGIALGQGWITPAWTVAGAGVMLLAAGACGYFLWR